MNVEPSKARKIEMLKKKRIIVFFYILLVWAILVGQFNLENNDSHVITYMYCSLLIFAKVVLSNAFYKFCAS